MTREEMEQFLKYLAIKGKAKVREEWLNCKGPACSIKYRNMYGNAGLSKLKMT